MDHSREVFIDKDYRVIKGLSMRVSEFEDLVNAAIREGYRPLGGIVSYGEGRFAQALLKEGEQH